MIKTCFGKAGHGVDFVEIDVFSREEEVDSAYLPDPKAVNETSCVVFDF